MVTSPDPADMGGEGLEANRAADALTRLGELAPDAVIVTDRSGRVLHASRRAEQMFGCSRGQLVGAEVEELIPERTRRRHAELRRSYMRAPAARPMGIGMELTARRADGSEFPVEISLNPLTADGPVVAFVRDISERKEVEQALRDSEERFQLLVDNLAEYAIFMLDPSGIVTTWNRGSEKVEGYAAEEIIGRHISVVYLPEDQAAGLPEGELDRAAAAGHLEVEGWRQRPDGGRFWASTSLVALKDTDGELRGFGMVTRDMTADRLARARLEALSDITRAILQSLPTAEVLQRVAEHSRRMLGAVAAWVMTADRPSEAFVVAAADIASDAAGVVPRDLRASESWCLVALDRVEPLVVHDVSDEDAHALGLPGGLLGPMLFVPFRAEGVAEGVLVVANVAGAAPFSELEVDLLKLFGSQITVALGFGTARAELEEMSLLEDRERIARDLHDTVIQRLFAVGMSLEGATRLIKFEPLENRVEEAVTQLDEIIRAIRLTIFTLEDRLGPDLGIRTEVMAVVAEAADQLGFSPDVDFEGPVDASIGPEVADQLLPCLREALSNVARHAGASRVEVRLRADEAVVLQVVDDGVGLGRTGRPDDPLAGGNGLRNMALRAERLGGSMGVESRPAGGTVIDWRVPLASAAGRSTASTGAPAGASSRSPEGG